VTRCKTVNHEKSAQRILYGREPEPIYQTKGTNQKKATGKKLHDKDTNAIHILLFEEETLLYTDVGSQFEPACYSRKIILQRQEM
jgi:hypothetical protein